MKNMKKNFFTSGSRVYIRKGEKNSIKCVVNNFLTLRLETIFTRYILSLNTTTSTYRLSLNYCQGLNV